MVDLLAVHHAAGADLDDLGHLGLLLGGTGQDDAALGLLLRFDQLDNHTVCKGLEFHKGFLLHVSFIFLVNQFSRLALILPEC